MDTATMKYYYDHGLWTIDRLDKLLVAGENHSGAVQRDYLKVTKHNRPGFPGGCSFKSMTESTSL